MNASTTSLHDKSATTHASKRASLSVTAIQRAQRGSRRESVLPLCMSRVQQEAAQVPQSTSRPRRRRGSSVHSGNSFARQGSAGLGLPATTGGNANGWVALLARPEANPELARAVQMCSFYPTMRVAGTAFENSLNTAHRQNTGGFRPSSGSRRGTDVDSGSFSGVVRDETAAYSPRLSLSVLPETSTVLREAMDESRSWYDTGAGASGVRPPSPGSGPVANNADSAAAARSFGGGVKMVQKACAMKRAAMWEVVVVTALAHRTMELQFRRRLLRRALERHLLPTLLQRKAVTGSVVAKGAARRRAADGAGGGGGGGGESSGAGADAAPQGSYLREHDAFFDSLHNSALLQSFAETMARHRFLPGDIIARAGQPSQKAMFFLISGKCEVSKEQAELAAGEVEESEAHTPSFKAGTRGSAGPSRSRSRRPGDGTAGRGRTRTVKQVIMPGTSFGGIFGGSAVFAGTYKALSQCIVWELRAAHFEQVFRPFADRAMLDKYKEAMRAHSLEWLQQRYSIATAFASIPIYRKLTSRRSSYFNDFTPVVKVRGEVLFTQNEAPGDVYCLLEGTVLRQTKGTGGTHGSDGVAQRLGTNSFSALNAVGRSLLLGEEPHILPGVQPYSCTVSSRVALFYTISGERFVNALLDDPTLYVQLRERLLQQQQANMQLHPECLAYVPLLQRFPADKREELVQFAVPRVLGRSMSLCEPAQHLSELMIVVSGDVSDPRRHGHKPARPLTVPASCEVDNTQEEGGGSRQPTTQFHGRAGKGDSRRRRPSGSAHDSHAHPHSLPHQQPQHGNHAAAARGLGSKRGSFVSKAALEHFEASAHGDTHDDSEEEQQPLREIYGVEWRFSVLETAPASGAVASNAPFGSAGNTTALGSGSPPHALGGTGVGSGNGAAPLTVAQQQQRLLETAALVCPDESEEINPPLPPQPARRFTYAVGGSWEALMLEKWPNGWETASTVALWAIPTHKLRLVFNSCPKPTQVFILNGLRLAQKEDQQLPTIPHTKLPPMTVYTQRGEAAVAAATAAAAVAALETHSQSTAKSSLFRKLAQATHASQLTQPSRATNGVSTASALNSGSVVAGGRKSRATAAPGKRGTTRIVGDGGTAASQAEHRGADGQQRQQQQQLLLGAASAQRSVVSPRASEPIFKSKPLPDVKGDLMPRIVATTGATPALRDDLAWRAEDGPSRSLVRLRGAAAGNGGGAGGDGATARAGGGRAAKSLSPAAIRSTATVDPAWVAAYGGELETADPLMLRIVRDPVTTAPSGSNSSAAKSAAPTVRVRAVAECAFPPIHKKAVTPSPASSTARGATESAAWPTQTPAHDRWFQAVPSYEPLPGTMRAADTLAAPPVFAPNSTVLTSTDISAHHDRTKTLEAHVSYYETSTLAAAATAAPRTGEAAGNASSTTVSPRPLPKRHAYA